MALEISGRVELGIARCRLLLSAVTAGALLLDQARTPSSAWIPTLLGFDMLAMAIFGTYFAYSLAIYLLAGKPPLDGRLAVVRTWADLVFAVAVGVVTNGHGSPFLVFFIFAMGVLSLRRGFRGMVTVTALSMAFYLGLSAAFCPDRFDHCLMQALYLGIIGGLICHLARQRMSVEAERTELARTKTCARIARELHDGCVQTLSAVDLKLASCAELLRRGRAEQVLTELRGLRASVNSEHDGLRAYMERLAGLRLPAGSNGNGAGSAGGDQTRFVLKFDVVCTGTLVDEVLQILREGIRNVRQHARATLATVNVRSEASALVLKIDDDGVGFSKDAEQPWTIASRVSALGGCLRIRHDGSPGAHLEIKLNGASSPREGRERGPHPQRPLEAAA